LPGGSFLDHEQTLRLMQSEYVYPQLADRSNYDDWKESGKRDLHEVAHERVKKLLADSYPEYIDLVADAKIREHFPIMLKPEDMKP
jgi:trimethylamine--corrinoid protein Co-methyltransferase